jgi:hypothetical protein
MVVAPYRLNTNITYNYFALLSHMYLTLSKYVLSFINTCLVVRLNIFLQPASSFTFSHFLLQHSALRSLVFGEDPL